MVGGAGLALAQPIHYGLWSGRYGEGIAQDGQDMVVLRRAD